MLRRTAKERTAVALDALPLASDEVWEGGWGSLSTMLREEEGEEPFHPELALWVVAGEGFAIAHALTPPGGGETALVEAMLEAMRRPLVGKPRRPGTIRVRESELAGRLQELLGPLGVAVEVTESLPDWSSAFNETDAALQPPGEQYRPASDEEAEALAALFRSAAAFYRSEPWRLLDDERPLGLEVPAMPGQTFGLTVMGSAGENRGLVVYPSLEDMADFYAIVSRTDFTSLDLADLPPSLSLNFSGKEEMPADAVEEAQARGWELAAGDAYPLLLTTEPSRGCVLDLSPQPVLLMTIALQAVTRFWTEAEAELRANNPAIVRDVELDFGDGGLTVRVSCPPPFPGPRRRTRTPARGPRRR
jgi:hypothetical protein